jgi:hypothetical protein
MSNPILPPPSTRFLAVDLHKDYAVVGGVSPRLDTFLSPRRIELSRWSKWVDCNILPSDILVVESTSNAWDFFDQASPLVSRVVVANPRLVKLISAGRVKIDKIDTMALAGLLAANLIPEVWVPPVVVRDARGLLAHRRRLVHNRTIVTNRLQSLLLRHNLPAPDGNPFSLANLPWWETLPVSSTENLRIRQDLATLDHLSYQISELEAEVIHPFHPGTLGGSDPVPHPNPGVQHPPGHDHPLARIARAGWQRNYFFSCPVIFPSLSVMNNPLLLSRIANSLFHGSLRMAYFPIGISIGPYITEPPAFLISNIASETELTKIFTSVFLSLV